MPRGLSTACPIRRPSSSFVQHFAPIEVSRRDGLVSPTVYVTWAGSSGKMRHRRPSSGVTSIEITDGPAQFRERQSSFFEGPETVGRWYRRISFPEQSQQALQMVAFISSFGVCRRRNVRVCLGPVRSSVFAVCRRRPRASLTSPGGREDLEEKLRNGSQGEQMRAMIVLPQLPSEESVALLHSAGVLRSENRQVRLTAVATLGKLGMRSEGRTLLSVLRDDVNEDYSVRAAAANALGILLEPRAEPGGEALVREAVNALIHAVVTDESFIVRYSAIVSLGNMAQPTALSTLMSLVSDTESPPLEASAAVTAVGEMLPKKDVQEEVFAAITRRARDPEQFVRASVARTLGRWKGLGNSIEVLHNMQIEEAKEGKSVMVQTILREVLDPGFAP